MHHEKVKRGTINKSRLTTLLFQQLKLTKQHLFPKQEALVFNLIARQYLMQFYPEYDYLASYIKLEIEGGLFEAKGNTPIALGWKALLPNKNKSKDPEDENQNELPKLSKNEELWCIQGQVQEKVTTPPAAFTDATLLAAMTGISRFVTDKDI